MIWIHQRLNDQAYNYLIHFYKRTIDKDAVIDAMCQEKIKS